MRKTAVEWLLKELDINPKATILKDLIEQAKEMEKQQIIDAYKVFVHIELPYKVYEDIYNETFKK
jgi:hypothetical protein